jgi:hypothetical protein
MNTRPALLAEQWHTCEIYAPSLKTWANQPGALSAEQGIHERFDVLAVGDAG